MTKEEAKEILLKYTAENQKGVISEAISTYFSSEEEEYDDDYFYEDLVNTSYFETLEEDGLNKDITVTIDGNEYPLFIDYFHTDINKKVRTYFAHYYKGESDGRMLPECVYYTFTNKDMSNINR